MGEWNEIKKRPMDDEERKEWNEELGYEIADEDAFIYWNFPEEGEEVLITTSWNTTGVFIGKTTIGKTTIWKT